MAENSLGVCIHRIPVEQECLLCTIDCGAEYDPDDFDYTECDHGNPTDECEECFIEEGRERSGGKPNV